MTDSTGADAYFQPNAVGILARALPLLVLSAATGCRPAGQRADPAFRPSPMARAVHGSRAPQVLIDEAHGNFHTATGRYRPFADVLRAAGYRVGRLRGPLAAKALRGASVLVIANALAARNRGEQHWVLPTPPAFTAEEVRAVKAWVTEGGGLLLIADHMPFPGAVTNLAAAFGVRYTNGFVRDRGRRFGRLVFRRAAGTLRAHPITYGPDPVDHVVTFTGSAIRPAPHLTPLLVFGPRAVSLEPRRAWRFDATTPRRAVAGWLQGAVTAVGKGRAAFFGEAALFTAQVTARGRRIGLTAPGAEQNQRFLLHVLAWLTHRR